MWQKETHIPGLAMTRAMGDLAAAKVGVIAEPEITNLILNNEDKFIVIASDGVWEHLSNQNVASLIYPFYVKGNIEEAVETVVEEAFTLWTQKDEVVDDITCIVLFLDNNSR